MLFPQPACFSLACYMAGLFSSLRDFNLKLPFQVIFPIPHLYTTLVQFFIAFVPNCNDIFIFCLFDSCLYFSLHLELGA